MAQEQEQNNRSQQLENARVGYQVATSLWIYEGGLIWLCTYANKTKAPPPCGRSLQHRRKQEEQERQL
jgi:hypothetical protein